MKTFKVRPAESFALEFNDGKTIEMRFNTNSMSILAEQINNKKIELTGPSFISAIIYAGAKSCNPDFTEEEANALYVTLNDSMPDALNGILDEYCKSVSVDAEELKKNAILKMVNKKK